MGAWNKVVIVVLVAAVTYWLLPGTGQADIPPEKIADKNVVITGASAGIGEQLAYQYAQLGANVFITARTEHKLAQVVERCREISPHRRHGYVTADMTQPEQVTSVIQEAVKFLGRLDYVILNHAVIPAHGFWQGSVSNMTSLRNSLEGTFLSHVQLAGDAIPHLAATNGSLTVVSSAGAKIPLFLYTPYTAAKHALEGFFSGLRAEHIYRNIDVSITIVTLGATATDHAVKMRATLSELLHLDHDPLSWMPVAGVEDTAREMVWAAASRQTDVWYPPYQHLWLATLLNHIFPDFMEDPRIVFGGKP